jgi:hypothetical protein
MIKLSQRAWNNVLIVSMLMLITMFNFSANWLNGDTEQQSTYATLLPAGSTITTIVFEHKTLERIGQGWRVNPSLSRDVNLEQLANHWLHAELQLAATSLSSETMAAAMFVQVWVVGQKAPFAYQFFHLSDRYFVEFEQQLYQLYQPSYQMLILDQ